jgi:hypothetical protein
MRVGVISLLLGGLALVGLHLPAGARIAKLPSASTSWLASDSVLAFCPAAEDTFTFAPRDLANNALPGVAIELDFCNCPAVTFCPPNGTENYSYLSDCRVRSIADGTGIARFALRGGGLCTVSDIQVYGGIAGGAIVQLGWPRRQFSLDQNGDLVVDQVDEAIVEAKRGTADPSADFDLDGRVTTADVLILENQHSGHSCTRSTPVHPGSWGALKVIYR